MMTHRWLARPGRTMTAALVAASLALSGCQGQMPFRNMLGGSTGATDSPHEVQLKEDADRFNSTVLGGTVAGCAVGAVISALGCKLSGSDAHRVRGCALAGCVVLGAAGAADGYYTAKQQQASRDRVRTTNAIAADVRQDNEKIQSFLASSSKVLADSRARLRQIEAQTAARRISADEAARERRKIEQNRDLMQSTLDDMKKSRDVYRDSARKAEAASGANRDLDREIGQMNQKIGALEHNVREMNAALSVTRS